MHKSAVMVPPPAASQPGRSLNTLNFSLPTLLTMKLMIYICIFRYFHTSITILSR